MDQSKQTNGTQPHEKDIDRGEEVILKIVKNPFHMNESARKGEKDSAKILSTSRMATNSEISQAPSAKSSTNSWLLSATNEHTSQSTNSEPIANPWLAASYKKSSKKSSSENRINKIQNKRKRDEQDNEEARVNIDTSIEAINEKLTAAAREREEDEDTPTMTYGRGKIAFQQTELINRAFAADGFEQDFSIEKEAAVAEDAPKEEDLTLPGWGSWTGQGVKRRATEKKLIKKIPGIEESKRKDAKLKHVIINEKRVKNVSSQLIRMLIVEREIYGVRSGAVSI